jgi:hypothetical protein
MFLIDKQKLYLLCAERTEPVTTALKKAGCSVAVLHNICNGRKVQVQTIGKLSKYFGVNVRDLIAG